jgi:hypothetical protein
VTADRLVVGTLAALFIAAIAFDVFDVTRPPSVADCTEDWNERAGSAVRAQITSGEFRLADAKGWVAKRSYPGCSVIFVTDRDRPWLTCIRTSEAADARLTEWSCEGGENWGRGRSSGSQFLPNATVASDGKLVAEHHRRRT